MNSLYRMLLPAAICAAACAQSAPPAIKTSARAAIQVTPDQAQVDIGVVTQARTAQEASSQNAVQTQAAIAKVKAAGGPKIGIRTSRYSFGPIYSPPKVNGGKAMLDGYSASNTIVLTCRDLSILGKVIDAATAGGANEIQGLQFSLKDEGAVRARALRQAALEAWANAESMAGALGLKLGRILLLEQTSPPVIRPMMMSANARVAGAPVPIEAGAIDVEAMVTLTVAVD